MADEWTSGETDQQLLENNQGVDGRMVETLKRKVDTARTLREEFEEEDEVQWLVDDRDEETKRRDRDDRENEEPSRKKQVVEQKCPECQFKCYSDGEMKTHCNTSHGGMKKMKLCGNCNFTCSNVWEMDFHCRSRGHKAKKDEGVPCKKCDYICENKDDVWAHKRVHIPAEKLVECGDCIWVGDRLDNIRYHCGSTEHKMKMDYESLALAKAEAKGSKEVAAYQKKLAKDMKRAKNGK